MRRVLFIGVLLLIVIALGLGLWLGGRAREPTAYEMERTAMSLKVASAMVPFQIAFRVFLGGVVLFTIAGLGWGAVRWLNHRISTLYPNHAGLYPIREERIGQARVYHDPNRTVTGTTVYASTAADGRPLSPLAVQHPLPPGQEAAQWQVTGQAQATQALRAAVSGSMPLPPGQLAGDLFDQRRLSRPLPEVKQLELEPMHIERLLLENGEQ
jgi:hypothetical protein